MSFQRFGSHEFWRLFIGSASLRVEEIQIILMTENTCCIITSCVIDVITHQIFIHVSMAPLAILLYALYAFSILFEIL